MSTCKKCGVSLEQLVPNAEDYVTGDQFTILFCKNCMFGSTYPVPTDLGRHYQVNYREYGGVVAFVLGFFYRSKVARWAKHFSQPGKVLEIGCGPGLMLKALKDLGWTELGLERTERQVDFAVKTFSLNVKNIDLYELEPNQTFDLIILFNVLEHITDPCSFLERVSLHMNANSRLIIAVPNILSWQARVFGKWWVHLDPPRHLNHFSLQSIRETLERLHLRIDNLSFASFEHDPFGWLQSFVNWATGTQNHFLKFLNGTEKFCWMTAFSFFIMFVGVIPACLVAVTSWCFYAGAILTVEVKNYDNE